MNKKIVALLSSILFIFNPILLFASDELYLVSEQNVIVDETENIIILHEEFSDKTTSSQTFSFETTTSQPYYKLYLFNGSAVDYIVLLPNGYEYILKSGTGLYMWNTLPEIGLKDVSITSTDGSNLFGRIIVRISDNIMAN